MIIPIVGLLIGILIAYYIPATIPYYYSKYTAVAILACLDSVFGGITAVLEGRFKMSVFMSGFFGNSLLAAGLTFIGEKLGVDLFMAAIFAFGNRLFLNFAIIRRYLLNKYLKKDNI